MATLVFSIYLRCVTSTMVGMWPSVILMSWGELFYTRVLRRRRRHTHIPACTDTYLRTHTSTHTHTHCWSLLVGLSVCWHVIDQCINVQHMQFLHRLISSFVFLLICCNVLPVVRVDLNQERSRFIARSSCTRHFMYITIKCSSVIRGCGRNTILHLYMQCY